MKVVLASSSHPRQALMRRLQLPFTVAIPDIDETPHLTESPADLVQRLAQEKALAVAGSYPDACIIGADQVGSLRGHILTKPYTYAQAARQLQSMSGEQVDFLTGVCVFNAAANRSHVVLEITQVTFKVLTAQMIANYLQKEQVLACAGSFQVEGLGIALVESINGGDTTALIGLPLIRLVGLLAEEGVQVIAG